jgi:predicted dehydrogenase
MSNKLRMGMIGGGKDAFIGAVHRIAANMDGEIELVCGAFSSSAQKSIESGLQLGLDKSRCYGTYEEMIEKELQLPEDKRMQFVSIVTPNHLHFAPAKKAMENGFHVVLDKPVKRSYSKNRQVILFNAYLYGLSDDKRSEANSIIGAVRKNQKGIC